MTDVTKSTSTSSSNSCQMVAKRNVPKGCKKNMLKGYKKNMPKGCKKNVPKSAKRIC